jgi:hypothetical protein
MADRRNQNNRLSPALTATGNLWNQEFTSLKNSGNLTALATDREIEHAPHSGKSIVFYRNLVLVRNSSVAVLAETYRRCVKLAFANPQEIALDPAEWAWSQVHPAVFVTIEWLRDWYILACDGENQHVRRSDTIEVVPGQIVSLSIPLTVSPDPSPRTWRAPAWVFQVFPALTGIGLLKQRHLPANGSEEKLGEAHSRLLLCGARRVFLRELAFAIERVRNEETSAIGAIPSDLMRSKVREPINRKGWEQREKLYDVIREILNENPTLQGIEFCAALDKKHPRPLYDWIKCGDWRDGLTWKEAWGDLRLRKKIRRVRQEAQKYRD